jgi:transmembrane sensor
VRLEDGTRLTLAPDTRVTVNPITANDGQVITLEGAAYFEVVPGHRTPFVVRARHTTTRVLGTEFSVRNYRESPTVRVAVRNGRVQTDGSSNGPVTLAEGMVASFVDSTVTVRSGDLTAELGWAKGPLEFRSTPLPEALATLEHWYGIRFRVADSLLTRETLTGAFNYRSSDNMLAMLKTALDANLTLTRSGTTTVVTLRARQATGGVRNAERHISPTGVGR